MTCYILSIIVLKNCRKYVCLRIYSLARLLYLFIFFYVCIAMNKYDFGTYVQQDFFISYFLSNVFFFYNNSKLQ